MAKKPKIKTPAPAPPPPNPELKFGPRFALPTSADSAVGSNSAFTGIRQLALRRTPKS